MKAFSASSESSKYSPKINSVAAKTSPCVAAKVSK